MENLERESDEAGVLLYDGGSFQLRAVPDNYVLLPLGESGHGKRNAVQYFSTVDGLFYSLLDYLVRQRVLKNAPYRELKDFVEPLQEAVAEVREIGTMLKDAVRVDAFKAGV